jgi:hypothetical protein
MELTKVQKKLIVLAGTSVLSLVVDQVFFSPSRKPHGGAGSELLVKSAATDGGGPAVATGSGNAAGTGSWEPPELSVDRLQRWGARGVQARLSAATQPVSEQLSQPRDIFYPNGVQPRVHAPEVVAPTAPAVHVNPHAQFVKQYSLTAVIVAGAGREASQALVNDRLLRVGQRIGNYRLVALDTRSALFRNMDLAENNPEATVRLRLSDAAGENAYSSVK